MLLKRRESWQCKLVVLGVIGAVILLTDFVLITGTDSGSRLQKLRVLEVLRVKHKEIPKLTPIDDIEYDEAHDHHPIASLMRDAAEQFHAYESSRSQTFAQAVKTYRSRYGRHPPPGFDKWYIFARKRRIYHLDDFDQIFDDLRPFWSIPPSELRILIRGMINEDPGQTSLAGIAIVNGKTQILNSQENWRAQTFVKMLNVFAKDLPDMEMVMNKLDQPRVIVEWDNLQEYLKREKEGRTIPLEVTNAFSKNKDIPTNTVLPTVDWFKVSGKPYMDLVAPACPPDSYARLTATMSLATAEAKYKVPNSGGLVYNFNTSSDLCTVGPALKDLHGLLFSASTMIATKKLLPVFGECKVNVNNDILFPANMYYMNDKRYEYDSMKDVPWEGKSNVMFWRGITSGGVQTEDTWRRLHRHRLVLMTNATNLENTNQTVDIMNWASDKEKSYVESKDKFHPSEFTKQHMDVGFPEARWCVPDEDCGWLKEFFTMVRQTTLTDQFTHKYLVDVDGHSFSGRWNAFLKSRSMGIKATIFREWHDSRLFAWLHFVPMDNRFDDLYTLLTYFIGLGTPGSEPQSPRSEFYVPSHDSEAKRIANQSRKWAEKVLRKEDIEIYMFRLMLEYARLLDDNRDRIGYGGNGSEMDRG